MGWLFLVRRVSKRRFCHNNDSAMKSLDFIIAMSYNWKQKEVLNMAQTVNVNFRMDQELKKNMEQVCENLGLSMTTAFTIFAKKVARENRIPFEVSVDPFYSKSNIQYLERIKRDIDEGNAHFAEHQLIEVDD